MSMQFSAEIELPVRRLSVLMAQKLIPIVSTVFFYKISEVSEISETRITGS